MAHGSPRWSIVGLPRVVLQDLPRPLDAGDRQRLRLHLVAPVLHAAAPALLVGEHGRRDGRGERSDQHRQNDRGAARVRGDRRQRPASLQREPSLDVSPPSSVIATRTARGTGGSPSAGQRSRQSPRASR